jgi:hypothetical protein
VDDPESDTGRGLLKIDSKRSYLVTPFVGLGIKSGPLALEVNSYAKVGGQYAPMKQAETVTLSYRMAF